MNALVACICELQARFRELAVTCQTVYFYVSRALRTCLPLLSHLASDRTLLLCLQLTSHTLLPKASRSVYLYQPIIRNLGPARN